MRVACCLLLLAGSLALVSAATPCRFAPLFDGTSLFNNPAQQAEFAQVVAGWEGQFAQPNPCAAEGEDSSVGYHAKTGMTLDGHRLSIETGQPLEGGQFTEEQTITDKSSQC
jgi:hypothetical protein